MASVVLFMLGIANFAFHKAVLASGHPLLARIAWLRPRAGIAPSLVMEFAVLVAALLFAANGHGAIAWAYGAYTALNAATAWLILSRRV